MNGEPEWLISEVDIRDGFLTDLRLALRPGLTCIIGPRGSGKSTLASAIRYAIAGLDGASKQRLDLYKANLSRSVVTLRATRRDGNSFLIRREGRNSPILTAWDGHALSAVDLDRGTFLPLDAYSAGEIEDIANEDLGPKRRVLLDQLNPTEHQGILDQLASARRELDSNADQVRAAERDISSLQEQILTVLDARDRLAALGPIVDASPEAEELQKAARQEQANTEEASRLKSLLNGFSEISARAQDVLGVSRRVLAPQGETKSANADLLKLIAKIQADLLNAIESSIREIDRGLDDATSRAASNQETLGARHLDQAAAYAKLKESNEVIGKQAKERAEAEQAVAKLNALEAQIKLGEEARSKLLTHRRSLRSKYISVGDQLSDMRANLAKHLQQEAGGRVRIALRRSADKTEYLLQLAESLRGAGVGRHESIVDSVGRLRPDELAQLITSRNYPEFASSTGLESERARKVLDAFRMLMDPFKVEALRPDDMVTIELNVGKDAELFRDASKLSQGQKCTALLPLLLARRHVPLVIDQPEDNLDNHFVFETVVQSLLRVKSKRQMVFVTHNANIPVLAEAELIVVLNSDGETGRIEKVGSVDECREEIIDLLEGGEEAFERRRLRYERG